MIKIKLKKTDENCVLEEIREWLKKNIEKYAYIQKDTVQKRFTPYDIEPQYEEVEFVCLTDDIYFEIENITKEELEYLKEDLTIWCIPVFWEVENFKLELEKYEDSKALFKLEQGY